MFSNCYSSPAKINLFFRIIGKRADGYHEISTLMQTIDLCDCLIVQESAADAFSCSDCRLPDDSTNLVIRARDLFRKKFSCPPIRIELEKKIPMQSGLGGGSSNAATILWALNEMTGKRASIDELMALSATLGADVPFFFSLGSAHCTGLGEKINPVIFTPFSGSLFIPPFGMMTKRVFLAIQESDICKTNTIDDLCAFPHYGNDLEKIAFRIEPKLQLFKSELLKSTKREAIMTGSGSAFFIVDYQNFSDCSTPFHSLLRNPSEWYSIHSCASL